MKLIVLALIVSTLVSSDALRRWYPSRACVDCRGYYVWPGMNYYDGCNWCRCRKDWTASCTLRWCKWNECSWKKRFWNN